MLAVSGNSYLWWRGCFGAVEALSVWDTSHRGVFLTRPEPGNTQSARCALGALPVARAIAARLPIDIGGTRSSVLVPAPCRCDRNSGRLVSYTNLTNRLQNAYSVLIVFRFFRDIIEAAMGELVQTMGPTRSGG
jgi:hypothetical protein